MFILVSRLFFEACDGIFLNYTWSESSLERSKCMSSESGRRHDVYVGVDVFGRDCCWGDGGFDTVKVLTSWWRGVAATRRVESTKLLCGGPG